MENGECRFEWVKSHFNQQDTVAARNQSIFVRSFSACAVFAVFTYLHQDRFTQLLAIDNFNRYFFTENTVNAKFHEACNENKQKQRQNE